MNMEAGKLNVGELRTLSILCFTKGSQKKTGKTVVSVLNLSLGRQKYVGRGQ
jgi:hypothetical protein